MTQKLAALLGDPVEHSMSPYMHNAAFESLGLPMFYMAFRVAGNFFADAFVGLAALGAVGANITIPHKERAFVIVDERSPEAIVTGAVNTVVFNGEKSKGYNTDVAGVKMALHELGASSPAPIEGALLLGAGGAARAALCALIEGGFYPIFVMNRDINRTNRLLSDFKSHLDVSHVGAIAFGEKPISHISLIVNATSLGLAGNPFPLELSDMLLTSISEKGFLLDLVYSRDGETELVKSALNRGLKAISGDEVLLHQGTEAFSLFTGHSAPIEVMRAALAEGRVNRS